MENMEFIPKRRLELDKLLKVHGFDVHIVVDNHLRLHKLKYDKRKSRFSLFSIISNNIKDSNSIVNLLVIDVVSKSLGNLPASICSNPSFFMITVK